MPSAVLDALKAWGEQAFAALFGERATGRLFDAATSEEYSDLHLQISSDEPGVLYWPWEALRDPEAGVLSRTCQVERRLNRLRDPNPISDKLPRDCVNILLVTARPYEADVRYRSISRPLVDQIERLKLPAAVTILRPPTFAQLRAHLHERPDHYHILHFDGHGSYGANVAHDHPHALALRGLQGQLVFEDDNGAPDPQTAEVLSELLRNTRVPVVVLNACQSAMVDSRADDAFASVAAGLLRSGVRSVLAMAYSLYVSGDQQFLPAFYRQLFASGNVADATRAGRQQMLAQPGGSVPAASIRWTTGLSPWSTSKIRWMSPSSAKPRPRKKCKVQTYRKRPATRRTRTALSDGMPLCWSWSERCGGPRRGS